MIDCQNLDPLPSRINRNGFIYIKVRENEKAFIYEQSGYGKMIAFEVFKKVIKPESINWGKVFPAKIRFPNNEAFGKWAWSIGVFSDEAKTREAAISKFNLISVTPSARINDLSKKVLTDHSKKKIVI